MSVEDIMEILCDECEAPLTLAVDLAEGVIVGWCSKCEKVFYLKAIEVDKETLERCRRWKNPNPFYICKRLRKHGA